MKLKKSIIAFLLFGLIDSAIASDTFFDSIKQGDINFSLRYRYETVDQEAFVKDANASTLKTRLNFQSLDYKGFNFFIEADNVMEIFTGQYNAGAGNSPGNGAYPIIADPQGSELNQSWFNYNFAAGNNIKVGRQSIALDNQRFVGGGAWRQNDQTFDAISGIFTIGKSKLLAAYINNVNRIFGNDVPSGDHDNDTFLLNWSNKFDDNRKLSLYIYDINNKDVAAFSTLTYGVRFSSKVQKLNYGVEFANQGDAHNNGLNYSANYYRFDGGFQLDKINLLAGFEVLEGDTNNVGSMFITPLASLHAFNGWADIFTSTPNEGIKDAFFGISGNTNGFKWKALYHNFGSEDNSKNLGNEIDFSIDKQLSSKVSLLLKAAIYNADTFATDTEKLWCMVSVNF